MIKWQQFLLACLLACTLFLTLDFNLNLGASNIVVAQSTQGAEDFDGFSDGSDRAEDSLPTIVNELGALVPDWANISFSLLPLAKKAGSISLSDLPSELAGFLDYDISRIWEAGASIDSILKLGDLKDATSIKDLALSQVAELTGIELASISLEDFSLSKWQSIEDLVRAIPGLKDLPLEQVKPLYDLATSVLGGNLDLDNLTSTVGDLLDFPEIAGLNLEDLGDLSQYGILDIPGLIDSPLGDLNKWQDAFLGDIPGLKDVPFTTIFKGILSGGFVALHDVTYGQKEARRLNTITGSDVEGFNVPCNQDSCSYLELSGPSSLKAEALHGKQWIKGGTDSDAQMVKGGHRLLKVVNGGKEPTGRHPFGKAFKVVLDDTTESEGLGEFASYFRYCQGIYGCTPYFIGPLPWFNTHEDDIIFVGLNQTAEPPADAPKNPGLPPGTQLPPGVGDNPVLDSSPDDCETYKGVSVAALNKAIAKLESAGSGDYSAIGVYVCADSGSNCGRALGKYQFMTYNELARSRILRKPGGAAFLQRAENPNTAKSDLAKEILTYFPAQEQEAARAEWFKTVIDSAASEGRSGDDLVARTGEMHNAGIYSRNGTSSIYGDRVLDEYKKVKPSVDKACQQRGTCTGKLANPAPGYPTGSGFGMRQSPVDGVWRMHNGLDYPIPSGIPLKAVDGGKVVHAGWMGGYGNTVDIKHCDGRLTRYAHMSAILIAGGAAVAKGQVIGRVGSTGRSTGPHLHFEVHVNGRAVNPLTQIGG